MTGRGNVKSERELSAWGFRENAMRFSEARFHREFADAWGRTVEANKRRFGIGSSDIVA